MWKAYSSSNFVESFLLALVAAFCFGSWANALKHSEGIVDFPVFYTDFCLTLQVLSIVFFVTIGACEFGAPDVKVTMLSVCYAVLSGLAWALGNIIFALGNKIVGLGVTFPVCLGTSLLVGVTLCYITNPIGSAFFLFSGAAMVLLAVVCNSVGTNKLEGLKGVEEHKVQLVDMHDGQYENLGKEETVAPNDGLKVSFSTWIVILIFGGASLGASAMFVGLASKCITASGIFMVSSVAVLLTELLGMFILSFWFESCSFGHFASYRAGLHLDGCVASCIFGVGNLSFFIAGQDLGFALGYALANVSPLVAFIWAKLVKASRRRKNFQRMSLMFTVMKERGMYMNAKKGGHSLTT